MSSLKYKFNEIVLRFILLASIPTIVTYLIFYYFTPPNILLIYEIKCTTEDKCGKEFRQDRADAFKRQLEEKTNDLKLLEALSEVPFTDIIFWNIQLTNRSIFSISVSDPSTQSSEPADVVCRSSDLLEGRDLLLSSNAGIILKKVGPSEMVRSFDAISELTLKDCLFSSQSIKFDTTKGFLLAPGGILTIGFFEKYEIIMVPDSKSVLMTFLLVGILTLLGLPILRQGFLFIRGGQKYFDK